MRAALLLALTGCADELWNQRNLDCTDARALELRGPDLVVDTRDPDRGDTCNLALQGLRGGGVEREETVLRVVDVDLVELQMKRSRPPTTAIWTRSVSLDVSLDELWISLQSTDLRGRGQVAWETAEDPVEVTVDTEDHLERLQISTLGDVTLTLPDQPYRLLLDGGSVDDGGFTDDPSGPLIVVTTPASIVLLPGGG